MSLKNWFRFIALGLIWGSTFFWVKIGLQEVGPFGVVFFRLFIAAVALAIFFVFKRKGFPLKYWWLYLFLGFFNIAFPLVLVSWSEKHISSGMASIINSTQPLITTLLASLFIQEERLNTRRVIGLILGFSGVFLLMAKRIDGDATNQTLGIIAVVIAVFSYGMSSVFSRLKSAGVKPEDQALGQMLFGLVFVVPMMLTFESPFTLPVQPVTYLAFFFLGLLASFYASITWYTLLNEIGPSRLSMTTYMFPLVGVSMGAILLHETVDWRILAGGIMILGGIIIANSKRKFSQDLMPVENEQIGG